MFGTLKVPILGVIETMSYFVCDGCDKKHFIFRQGGGERLAREFGVALLGQIPIDPKITQGGDDGAPHFQAYLEAAGATAQQLSIINAIDDGALSQFSLAWKN